MSGAAGEEGCRGEGAAGKVKPGEAESSSAET